MTNSEFKKEVERLTRVREAVDQRTGDIRRFIQGEATAATGQDKRLLLELEQAIWERFGGK